VKENCAPGATSPEFHPVESDVDVCAMESLFVHVTVAPTATDTSSGAYALFASDSAPTGIATDDDGPPDVGDGVGDGEVDGDELLLPHAVANIKADETTASRISEVMIVSTRRVGERFIVQGRICAMRS
jgi:hypothetical protein